MDELNLRKLANAMGSIRMDATVTGDVNHRYRKIVEALNLTDETDEIIKLGRLFIAAGVDIDMAMKVMFALGFETAERYMQDKQK